MKPRETGLLDPFLLAYLKADRAIVVGVKGIEEKSSVGARVCGHVWDVNFVSSRETHVSTAFLVPIFSAFPDLQNPLSTSA